jgi:hypothetical protein
MQKLLRGVRGLASRGRDHEGMDLADVAPIALSAFFGAAVAFVADWLTRRREAKLKEEAAINNLIIDLAAKRAFLIRADWDWSEGEVGRVTDSIFDARDLVRDARLALRPRSKALPALRNMTTACNTFLQMREEAGDQQLKGTRESVAEDMNRQVQALHALRPRRVLSDAPGSSAL